METQKKPVSSSGFDMYIHEYTYPYTHRERKRDRQTDRQTDKERERQKEGERNVYTLCKKLKIKHMTSE